MKYFLINITIFLIAMAAADFEVEGPEQVRAPNVHAPVLSARFLDQEPSHLAFCTKIRFTLIATMLRATSVSLESRASQARAPSRRAAAQM